MGCGSDRPGVGAEVVGYFCLGEQSRSNRRRVGISPASRYESTSYQYTNGILTPDIRHSGGSK